MELPGRCGRWLETATVTVQGSRSGSTRRARGRDIKITPRGPPDGHSRGLLPGHQWGLFHGHGQPLASAAAFIGGAFVIVLSVGVGLFLGLDAVGDAVQGASTWVRRVALLLAALALVISGWRRLKPRQREAVVLPSWFGPWTAAPIGLLATAADLPNAFPYLIAIERLTASNIEPGRGVLILAGYALIYCLPCILLLVAGSIWHEKISARIHLVYERFGAARELPRSLFVAAATMAIGLLVGGLAIGW